ncbi:glycosyltransferase [Desulfovibrio subterraneus]|uniref:PGL/p-HBAD biosynthesis glycosyltransferase n=1 Tax=Desulfovibrio subterraneus TaxID=2718620 RepID=A0A7J0BHF0_9BACT|nr:nucleotide disphospho-sugar-binding domain-containing protein [Desulfovibrio subterraneus]GFM33183.1 PGL/p-HBAD biosynthesis glycosyltransferase [Desulfovibrio subterraneus]
MRILCIPYSHTYSHLSRVLEVGKELRQRGHLVEFAGESPKMRILEQEGFAIHPLFEPDPKQLFDNIRDGKLRFVDDTTLDRMIDEDVELFKSVRPDVVLTDGRFSARISTHIARIAHAAIVNVSSTAYRANPYMPLFPSIQASCGHNSPLCAMESKGWSRWLDALNLWLEMTIFNTAVPVFSKRSKQYGLPRTATATNCLAGGNLTLLADTPEYFPTRRLPPDYHYVGPIVWNGNSPAPDWWQEMKAQKDARPLIFVSMGSTAIPALFETVFSMLDTHGMRGVIATGGQTDGLPQDHPDIKVTPFIDGNHVLETSATVICHGGNGTIYQALGKGVPVIGIPTIPDQQFNMRRVESLGVGLTITPKQFEKSTATLHTAVQTILSTPRFADNAHSMQHIIAGYNAPLLCAERIEQLAASFKNGQ